MALPMFSSSTEMKNYIFRNYRDINSSLYCFEALLAYQSSFKWVDFLAQKHLN